MRERAIERYLHAEVTKAGGTTRKMKGRINDPDRLVLWPERKNALPAVHFVETKAPGEKARAGQLREHKRLRAFGATVLVLDTKRKVDTYVDFVK